MQPGVFDTFRLGIGPSASHTVGPMRAGRHFAKLLLQSEDAISSIHIDLYGSLAATGIGHGTDRAVLLGLSGAEPENVSTTTINELVPTVTALHELPLLGGGSVPFIMPEDLRFHPWVTLPYHVNGMALRAENKSGNTLCRTYYSIGGGAVVVQESEDENPVPIDGPDSTALGADFTLPHPFRTAASLLRSCQTNEKSIPQLIRENEEAIRSELELNAYLDLVLKTMFDGIQSGCTTKGTLPGGLAVPRRADQLRERLRAAKNDPLALIDWVTLYALAINEENTAGHRVVSAPTNGAAGVIPAVLGYHLVSQAAQSVGGLQELTSQFDLWDLNTLLSAFPQIRPELHDFLITASAVASLIKTNASVAGAEVGCQGEVGSASAMAAAGLAQAVGGKPSQVENAAEIAMEHSLGLTCDPVGGLVQIPCIERNAIAAVKAVSASRIALYGDGRHHVSLDVAVETMRQTGADMHSKYKETSVGGLAVNVVEC